MCKQNSHWVYWSNDLSTLLLSPRPYQAIQLIAVSSEGGAIPCFQLWTHRALIRFPLHFCSGVGTIQKVGGLKSIIHKWL